MPRRTKKKSTIITLAFMAKAPLYRAGHRTSHRRTALAYCVTMLAACTSPTPPAPIVPGGPSQDAAPSPDAAAYQRPRATVDLPDEVTGPQVHVLYVEPADRTAAQALDTDGTLRKTVASFQKWLKLHLGAQFRFDTYQGALDITYVKLAVTELDMALGTTVTPAGPRRVQARFATLLQPQFNDPTKMYLVYYDGLVLASCGASNRPDHMPGVYIGGVWQTSVLTQTASIGSRAVTVYDPVETSLPTPPFAATIDNERISVQRIAGTTITLAAPLATAHAAGALLAPTNRPADCRRNPFSRDGEEFGYATFVGLHELMHALGLVANGAPDFAPAPVAPGHLHANTPAGTEDLMYQGSQSGKCGDTVPSAALSPCRLDPGRRNYVHVATPQADLAKSAFLEPMPVGAVMPAGW